MGMYTELHFNAEMVRDLPADIVATLGYMAGQTETEPDALPEHPLFKGRRWEYMLNCDSAYFPMSPATSFVEEYKRWTLCVRSNFKNYDDEIAHFLDWIMPYVDADTECLGYYRYEEDDHPTLIYKVPPRRPANSRVIEVTEVTEVTTEVMWWGKR